MTAASVSRRDPGHGSRVLTDALHAEWTKFRTVRGWVIGTVLVAVLLVAVAYLTANGEHSGICMPGPVQTGGQPQCGQGHPLVPVGPDGEAVADSYYLVGQQLRGNGTITGRITALAGVTSSAPADAAPSLARTRPGLAGWSKAGLILTASTDQGSPYAAVMVTPAHGVRLQYDYTHDLAGPSDSVTDGSPRWLRLRRTGDVLTAYDSGDGASWHELGATTLAQLPTDVDIGLFVTSPVTFNGLATLATATFDHVTLDGTTVGGAWRGQGIGQSHSDFYDVLGGGGFRRDGSGFVVRGSGDIAPAVTASGDTPASLLSQALIAALLVMVVVATMFSTSEYRRGLIRTTLAAVPDRRHMLAAKAVVIGTLGFTVGTAAAAVGLALGRHLEASNGNYLFPLGPLTELRAIIGAGAILALTAVAVLALGVLVRRTAGAVTAGIVVFVLPAILVVPYVSGASGSGGSPSLPLWLLRLSPAAGSSILGSLPSSSQVTYPYTIGNGYFPLSPGVGLIVLAAWTVGLLALAMRALSRRDT
jgi:ABC-2 family transporter protein